MTGIEPYVNVEGLAFDKDNPPRIASRGDAILLLDRMIEAESVEYCNVALEALKDAIARGVI